MIIFITKILILFFLGVIGAIIMRISLSDKLWHKHHYLGKKEKLCDIFDIILLMIIAILAIIVILI